MTQLRLPAGTDVAEMAFFDVDALPKSRPPDMNGLNDLAARERLIRLPTGSDGGYLLHLYVDESLPSNIAPYCVAEDLISGQFATTSGRIAFGGLESTYQEFKPNRNIRTDAVITPGTYAFAAYRTDFPDELIEKANDVPRSPEEIWLDRAPFIIIIFSIALVIAFAVSGRLLLAILVVISCYLALRTVSRKPAYISLATRRETAQLEFPSIVIELRSN